MMKNKYILSVALKAVVLIGLLGIVDAQKTFAQQTGGAPAFIDLNTCSESAQFVISKMNLPKNLIHSCDSEDLVLEGEEVSKVHIGYGAGEDCSSGCLYNDYLGVVAHDRSYLAELPGPDGKYVLSLLYAQPLFAVLNKGDGQCLPQLESLTKVKIAKDNGRIGWRIDFSAPYECSWLEVNKTTVTQKMEFIQTGVQMKKIFTGSVFVYLNDKTIQWDFNNLKVSESEGKNF